MSDTPKPTLSYEDIQEQIQASEKEAKQHYDAYQQSLGIVAAYKHMLNRFTVPAKVTEEVK